MQGIQWESLAQTRTWSQLRPSQRVARWLWMALRVAHGLLALTMVWGCLVKFATEDSFLESGRNTKIYPRDLFHFVYSTHNTVNRDIQRVMNIPFVFAVLAYFAGCLYFHFKGCAWLLTAAALPIYITYFIIKQRLSNVLDWRYFSSRSLSIFLEVFTVVVSLTVTVVVVQWKRERLRFRLKSWWNIRENGPCHVGWNLFGHGALIFAAFTIWFSRLYSSYICVVRQSEVFFLCQFTTQVRCYYCQECTFQALSKCVSQGNHTAFQCSAIMEAVDKNQGAVCLFNYNVGYYTVIITFAYIGGVFFFLRNFLNATMHYVLVASHSVVVFWLNYSSCFCLPKPTEERLRRRLQLLEQLNTDDFHMVESHDLHSEAMSLSHSHRGASFGTFTVQNGRQSSDSEEEENVSAQHSRRPQYNELMNSV